MLPDGATLSSVTLAGVSASAIISANSSIVIVTAGASEKTEAGEVAIESDLQIVRKTEGFTYGEAGEIVSVEPVQAVHV